MRAAERFELCRLFGKGNARSGLYILTEMEHRAALAVMPLAKQEEDMPSAKSKGKAADQPNVGKEAAATAAAAASGRTKRRAATRRRHRQKVADAWRICNLL